MLTTVRRLARNAGRGAFAPGDGGGILDAPAGTRRERRGVVTIATHRVPIAGLAEPVSIAQVTDVHVRRPGPGLDALVDAIRDVEVDIVAVTGDVPAKGWTAPAIHHFLARLPRARLGRYAIMGNWEYWSGLDPLRWGQMLEPHGITLLRDEVVEVGPIRLAGVDDVVAADPDIGGVLDRVQPPAIALCHCPIGFDRLAGPDVALVLSGHTHGGQIRLGPLGPAWLPIGSGPYARGFYQRAGSRLYVCPGLGWSLAPIRVGVPRELAILELVPGDTA